MRLRLEALLQLILVHTYFQVVQAWSKAYGVHVLLHKAPNQMFTCQRPTAFVINQY
jgi:hypothetical protein